MRLALVLAGALLIAPTAHADTIGFEGNRRVCAKTTNRVKVTIPDAATHILYHSHGRGRVTVCWDESR